MLFKSQNISHLAIVNLPINITVSLVSHHTDNILMIKFRKPQFAELKLCCLQNFWVANKMLARPAPRRQIVSAVNIGLGHAFQNSQVFVFSFALVSHWSKNKRGPASLLFKPEIWSAGVDNGKTTIVIDLALPPKNTETFRFPTCLAATARRSVQFFRYPVGRTAKACWPAALQPSKHISAWFFWL